MFGIFFLNRILLRHDVNVDLVVGKVANRVAHTVVDMKVNKLTSIKTQLPYEYYALPFCQPTAARCMELVDGHRWRGRIVLWLLPASRCADTPLFGIALQPCN